MRTGVLTDLFFLICSTTDRGHLHTLARLSRLLSDEQTLGGLYRHQSARGPWITGGAEQALLD